MTNTKQETPNKVPNITDEQLSELRAKLSSVASEPLFPTGTISVCPHCGGKMVTTNDLEQSVATPGLVYVLARLPGARCINCESTELDAAGVALLEARAPRGIVADYETAVTHSSGTTLGTYFKVDLVRVLGLSGNERLFWKVVDRDKALVHIHRNATRRPVRTRYASRRTRVVRSNIARHHRRRKK
jgi:hypothetical protein